MLVKSKHSRWTCEHKIWFHHTNKVLDAAVEPREEDYVWYVWYGNGDPPPLKHRGFCGTLYEAKRACMIKLATYIWKKDD